MKWLKLCTLLLGIALVICVLAVGSVVYFIDPNNLKPVIIEEVQKQTGYILTIDGKMSWSFYPRVAVKIDHLQLNSPDHKIPFIDARDVRIATNISEIFNSNQKLRGNINIAHARLMKMNVQQLTAELDWQNNVITLNPIKAVLYRGKLEGSAIGRDFAGTPRWQWEMQAKEVEVKSLLQDVSGDDSKINVAGIGQLKFQAETRGKSREEMLNQLNGTGDFTLTDGAVGGIDLNYFVQTADAFINKSENSTVPENQHTTAFNRMTGSFVINNGSAETNNLLLVSQAFSAKARGNVELISRVLDFQLQVKPQQMGKISWRIPVVVLGTLEQPDVRLDTMELQQILAGQEIEKAKRKAIEHIKKHVHGKTGDLLQRLLR